MTTKPLYPNIRPALDLNFARTKTLDSRITFSRASTATFVGANGLVQTAASNVARFDHKPATGESLGLLVEEARTNVQLYSEQFDQWFNGTTLTVTANAGTSPSGTTTADKIIPSVVSGSHYVTDLTARGSGTFSFSVYAKASGYPRLGLRVYDGTAYQIRVTFDLSAGTVVLLESGTASITPVGNGWYRCSGTGTSASGNMGSTAGWVIESLPATATVQGNFAGDGTSGALLWGAQVEAGSFPSSYIPTTTATVTRAAEVVDITGGNFSSWFNSSVGTFFTDSTNMPLASNIALSTYNTTNTVAFALGTNAPDSGRAYVPLLGYLSNNTIIASVFHYNGGGTDFGPTIQNTISNAANTNKMAFYTDPPNQLFAVAVADQIATLNTNSGRTGANSYTLANMMRIGYNSGYYGNYNGRIKRITYYPTRLSNSQLLTLIAA